MQFLSAQILCLFSSFCWIYLLMRAGRGSFCQAQTPTLVNVSESIWGTLKYVAFALTAITTFNYNRFICFDEASPNLSQQPFEMRYSALVSGLSLDNPIAISNSWCYLFHCIMCGSIASTLYTCPSPSSRTLWWYCEATPSIDRSWGWRCNT